MITLDQIEDWEDSEAYYSPTDPIEVITPMNMVQEFCRVTDQWPSSHLYFSLIKEEYGELLETLDRHEELKELSDLVYVIYGYANAKGYDLDTAIKRVHENNIGRCVQADGTVKRREDGKIIKNEAYPKVYLGDLL